MSQTSVFALPSLRDKVSPDEWQARVDLAACYRLFDLYGMSDLAANHISVRVPGEESFLINPYGMLYDEMTASCLHQGRHRWQGAVVAGFRQARLRCQSRRLCNP